MSGVAGRCGLATGIGTFGRMLKVGLTGGIGSGKSWVSARLASHGAVVVDADLLAREVVAGGSPGFEQVVARFGPQVVGRDGRLDRQALADLNAIVHPLVGERASTLIEQAELAGVPMVVYDVPLLVENGLANSYDVVVVVDAPVEVQLSRLVGDRGMSRADALARIAQQSTRDVRLAAADEVLDNGGSLDELADQVDLLWQRLRARA